MKAEERNRRISEGLRLAWRRRKKKVRFTSAQYDEAIANLALAKDQLEPDGNSCSICGDSGHMAFECGHNPLVGISGLYEGYKLERLDVTSKHLRKIALYLKYIAFILEEDADGRPIDAKPKDRRSSQGRTVRRGKRQAKHDRRLGSERRDS